MKKTIYAKQQWFNILSSKCKGMSNGSVRKQRRDLWGDDAFVVRCKGHLFWVDDVLFFQIIGSNT